MHKSRVICKVPRKKSHMTWDLCIQKDAKHVMSTNSHTVHFTSHMNKDSILVYDYLLAVGIIQNYTSAVRIFQSHMNPFTSLFYLATIQQLFRSYLAALQHLFSSYLPAIQKLFSSYFEAIQKPLINYSATIWKEFKGILRT